MSKAIVIVPTYNEADNIILEIEKLGQYVKNDYPTRQHRLLTGLPKVEKKISTILILDNNSKWEIAEPEDQREFFSNESIKEKLKFEKGKYNRYVGFIGYKKNNSMLVFKTKDMVLFIINHQRSL